jgi:hypothetical protein
VDRLKGALLWQAPALLENNKTGVCKSIAEANTRLFGFFVSDVEDKVYCKHVPK